MKPKAKRNHEEKESRKSPRSDPEAERAMEERVKALIMAYLSANLDFKDIPLKQLMDNCEKKILLDCLRLNRGNQKLTAVLLGLKPTALFEKIRKHGIDIRQIKQFEKNNATPPERNS